ncbi:MAG: TAT-variant-translocated molybdopterin oxidoreductase [Candidatus Latescibacterota bacterium]|jgi:molybdopterin-containing oxidoreductase family iron-sulfur binding subunit
MSSLPSRKQLDPAFLRPAAPTLRGPEYWRSLDELAGSEAFVELLHREFPEQASEWHDPVSRRSFLKVMGASLAFGGLTACTSQPAELIVPQVRAPEEQIPGRPLFYATAAALDGVACGVLVESHMGRPTKIEGNPQHPGSLGGTHAITQASILDLYDPDRLQAVTNAGRISSWDAFLRGLTPVLEAQRLTQGAGLRILTGSVTSPTLAAQLRALRRIYPAYRWHQYDPVGRGPARAGSLLAFGETMNTWYDLGRAKVILSLDADFANSGPAAPRYARDFAARRREAGGSAGMNRLYLCESTPSATGSMADHRLALRPGEIVTLALAVARGIGVPIAESAFDGEVALPPRAQAWIGPLVRDLLAHRGTSAVIAGDQQDPTVHALAQAMNLVLGNGGSTVHWTAPLEAEPVDPIESLTELVSDLRSGRVEVMVILGGNPVYDAPVDLGFAAALDQARFRVHLTQQTNETSILCHWQVPESHYLEHWGDYRGHDGTVTLVQPLIEPLYGTRSAHELLAVLAGQAGKPGYDLVRQYWETQLPQADFEAIWRRALHDGVMAGTALPERQPILRTPVVLPAAPPSPASSTALELIFRPDPLIWDGRFANNGWLQETPKPVTKLTWDNAALIGPATAARLGLENEQVVELSAGSRSLRAPVWIVPGQAEGAVTVHLGYGRSRVGRVGTGTGFNANLLRTSTRPWSAMECTLTATGDRQELACTQEHQSMEGRALVRQADLEEFRQRPRFAAEEGEDPPADLTLYSGHAYPGRAWGMVIDLGACMGCNACTVACQAENNIPVVGKSQVRKGREMAWIRVDRYYRGDPENPGIAHQPVPCMHCENAPCEVVCPVAATVHSKEGLNDMVYNRCVGTRYCANNCPYKVRRFNFLQYVDRETESLKLQRNPDVTVRARGVMEKCTYCVQRINAARIEAKKAGQPVGDGEVVTACQQVCPTGAIAFGDLNDPASAVARLRSSPLHYGLLTELNTRPRTTYLAAVRNPNPELTGS